MKLNLVGTGLEDLVGMLRTEAKRLSASRGATVMVVRAGARAGKYACDDERGYEEAPHGGESEAELRSATRQIRDASLLSRICVYLAPCNFKLLIAAVQDPSEGIIAESTCYSLILYGGILSSIAGRSR